MADRRSVRSASRRKTPTPQPPSKPAAPQLGRASRARHLRSASRDIDDFVEIQKSTRRSARQPSVTTIPDDSENEAKPARQTARKPATDALGGQFLLYHPLLQFYWLDYPKADENAPDLTVVEEMDTEIAFEHDEAPGTPEATESEIHPFRSPGATSEMSGTTAISSISMVEADSLEPKFILKHMRKLCDAAEEFLEHIAPDSATMGDDLRNIQEMQKPGSDYTEEYLDYEIELNVHLKHFKSEEHSYILVRALNRALFRTNEDTSVSQTGLNLVLYLANLLVFAKQMIHSNRDDKNMWDVLRQLDNTFPVQFMHSIDRGAQPTVAGTSTLLQETFNLALELRTQLAILVLQKSAGDPNFDPDDMVSEIFLRSESSQAIDGSPIRGWNMVALGGDESPLPQELQDDVAKRVNEIRKFFPTDNASLQRGEQVRLEELRASFPWEPTILRLLAWVRLRHRELQAMIEELGGSAAIARHVKQIYENSQPMNEQPSVPSAPQESPRRTRTSFGRDRRRSSRKFDPNAAVDFGAMAVLKARERDSGVHEETNDIRQENAQEPTQQVVDVVQAEESVTEPQQQGDGLPEPEESEEEEDEGEQDEPRPEQDQLEPQPEEQDVAEEEQTDEPQPSGPPQSSAALHKLLKAASKPQKENRPVSIFDRQKTAQRIEFGDGFDDTQPTPGPSNPSKGKQPAESSSRKRSRPMDEDSDSDAFESEDRGLRVPERRRNAPVSKKARLDPSSSGVPPSHQPPLRPTPQTQLEEPEQDESVSETEAPDMTEDLPPSTYQAQRRLAQENRSLDVPPHHRNERKAREKWTHEAEEALCEITGGFWEVARRLI
ncbi:hypothetical protein DDE82_006349 [Stemphylium lycopersici]|nr:hypothetical protein DDE82_006349 [Stemphylium lycopersici]